jgi:competence protein ComEC
VSLLVGIFTAGLSLGQSAAVRAYHPPLLTWFAAAGSRHASPVILHGILREDAGPSPNGVALTLDVRGIGDCGHVRAGEAAIEPASTTCWRGTLGGVRLSVAGTLAAGRMSEWRAGRAVRVAATLREPTVYRNPGMPDEQRALARRVIALVGSIKSGALVDVTATGTIASEWAAAARRWVRTTLATTVGRWSHRSAGVAAAIAIGDRTGLAQEDERRLQEAGTYHVIAISGGNIAILTMLLVAMLRRMRMPPRTAAAATILALIFYGQITGPAPSIDRAIGAAVLYLCGRLLELRGAPLNIIAVAAVVGLAGWPAVVLDPGFILSFGATLGILVGVPRVLAAAAATRFGSAALVKLAIGLLAATVAAEIALAPAAAVMFARVTCAGLVLNFAAIPLMIVVQAGGLATLALSVVDAGLASGCGFVVHVAAHALIDSARLVDVVPWMVRDVAPPAWWLVVTYYGALVAAASRIRRSRVAGTVAALAGVAIAIGSHATARDAVARPAAGVLRVVFLDVGQGDATAVLLPDGRALLVDAGGLPAAPLQDPSDGPAFDVGTRVVSRVLRALGVRVLDTFVLTHADPDHIGGALGVVRAFRPRTIWEGVPVPVHQPLQSIATAADRLGAEWRTVQAGDRVRLGGIEIEVLHPPLPEWERQRVRNDDSVALALHLGSVTIVLPGDIGREGETLVRRRFERSPMVVVKAPHHGSATSSTVEFLNALKPQAVVFSAGRDNRFGHPAPAVVARYRALGAAMFSTADDGAVILDTDGKTVQIKGWASGKTVMMQRP